MASDYQPFDWYETPLYYDAVFDPGSDAEADFVTGVYHRYRSADGKRRLLEPACGTGRLVRALAGRGFAVTGFDLSEPSLRFARRRCAELALEPMPELVQGRMESFRFRRKFDLAYCLVSTFKYLPDEDAARSHLECVARALYRGGIYALGLHITDYTDQRRQRERWVAERDGRRIVCNIQSWPADRRRRTEQLRARFTVDEDGATRRFETRWTFRTYDLEQLERLLASVPALEHVATHDFDYRLERETPFDGRRLDVLLILRRR